MNRCLFFPALRVGLAAFWLLVGCGSILQSEDAEPSPENSGQTVQLAESPSLSPNGKELVFSWKGDIWKVSAEGGRAHRLTHHPANDDQPKYSPDGKEIAFVSDREGAKQIFVVGVDGGTPRQVSFHSEDYQLLDWFPDGESVLALSPRDHFWKSAERLIRVSVTQRMSETVLADAHATGASISPDGKQLLVTREGERWWRKGYHGERASQVWLFDLAEKQWTELLHEGYECRWPLWFPNGRAFYFTKGTDHGFDLWRSRLPRGDERSLRQRKVVGFDDDSIVQPTLSRDGSTIVFRHLFDLYRWEIDRSQIPEKLTITASDDATVADRLRRRMTKADKVAFSPNGLNIAFVAGNDLWIMDTELKEPIPITRTAALEGDPLFSPDGKTLWFSRSEMGQVDLWKVQGKDAKRPWWQQKEFIETRLTNSPATESRLRSTADGKYLVFQENGGDLVRWEIESGERHLLFDGFMDNPFALSPDGKWLAFAASDEYFNRDIWLLPIDGSREPTNVSQHPDNDTDPIFSPDGKILAFTGTREDDEVDIYYVYLEQKTGEETSRERTLAKALSKEKAGSKKGSTKSTEGKSIWDLFQPKPSESDDSKQERSSSSIKPIVVELDDIHRRVKRIATPQAIDRQLLFSGDSKKLLFATRIDGKEGWHSVEFPDDLKPKFYSEVVLDDAVWHRETDTILGANRGVPARLEKGNLKSFPLVVLHETSRQGRYREGFHAAWLKMRDIWYDPRLGGKNWDAIRRKYSDAAAQAADGRAFSTVIEMMLGELNGSHLGFTASREREEMGEVGSEWRTQVAHLGVRFDPDHAGPGLRVRDVLVDGPADRQASRLKAGEMVVAIDGKTVDRDTDLTAILDGPLSRDIQLQVRSAVPVEAATGDDNVKAAKPSERTVVIRPISYFQARELLYENWLATNREMVDRLSNRAFGYLHIRAMDTSSFHEFETQLYRVGYGRSGLIIDVRDNGGGSTTDYLLTALTQPRHAITVPRDGRPGYPQDRHVFATWSKPIVVLCNQNSYSNAEIFSHAIKNLGRGKLVGVQTAGGVVSTGTASIPDIGTLRAPFRGWFDIKTGTDMELHGALPDVVVWPGPDELPRGLDRQLETAVQLLLESVADAPSDPKLEYATERSKKSKD